VASQTQPDLPSHTGLTNSAYFIEIRRSLTDLGRSEFKKCRNTVYKFKKSKIKKYVKKLDEILRLLVKKFFQIGIIWLVKI
jgi:hypothetical protein